VKRRLVLRAILFIAGLVISTYALAYMIPTQVPQQQQAEKEQKQAEVEALYGGQNPYEINMSSDFTFCLGVHGFSDTVPAEWIANGTDVPNNAIYLGGILPLHIKITNGSLSISANVTDTAGKAIGYIQDNEWKSATNQSLITLYDINNNNFAFEVVDNVQKPLLQIKFISLNTIDITGYLRTSSNGLVVANDSGLFGNPTEPVSIAPIFLYPSSNHKGELANPDLFLPESERGNIPLSAWLFYGGLALAVAGAALSGLVVWDTIWETLRDKNKQN
jgi:hypothetical protein